MDIYDKILETANHNMRSSGQSFSFGSNAFKSVLYRNPQEIDILEFREVKGMDFLFSAYLRLLNRFPDPRITKNYQNRCSRSNSSNELINKYYLITFILKSEEFKRTGKEVVHFMEFKREMKNASLRNRVLSVFFDVRSMFVNLIIMFLSTIWKCLPGGVKKCIISFRRKVIK